MMVIGVLMCFVTVHGFSCLYVLNSPIVSLHKLATSENGKYKDEMSLLLSVFLWQMYSINALERMLLSNCVYCTLYLQCT